MTNAHRDPDDRGPGHRAAHGRRLDALTTGRVPECALVPCEVSA